MAVRLAMAATMLGSSGSLLAVLPDAELGSTEADTAEMLPCDGRDSSRKRSAVAARSSSGVLSGSREMAARVDCGSLCLNSIRSRLLSAGTSPADVSSLRMLRSSWDGVSPSSSCRRSASSLLALEWARRS